MATDFLKLAQDAFENSSAFVDANYRADWDYSLRAFRNEHAQGSKYNSPEFAHRSKIFRPKTRSITRKNEAAAAVALFSNSEVVDISPMNPDDTMNVAGAEALKEVIEYRLSYSIPAFPLVMGGVQDAQVQGAVVSYNYWEYQVKDGRKVKDKPCIELRPIENIRLDGGASWLDPVNTSPYFCDIIPMYVCDVKGMMKSKDEKTGQPKWKKFDDDVIARARPDKFDSTRKARQGNWQEDPHQQDKGVKAYDVVWVLRWFMRDEVGDDYTFYTLGTDELLTDPKPIEEVYFHGQRPYTMGFAILETHKAVKTSLPVLIKPLQQETNDVASQRLDNVKFVLNKRWLVARGRQTDVNSLVRNTPGGVTLTADPKTDIVESNWPDVTSSSYVEQDRINADMDDLAGNFSPSTKVANNAVNDTLGGSKMAAQGAGIMTDYLLRTIIETWWEPTLRHLVLLEQYYETDEVILGICAQKARLFPKFGISQITDDLLMKQVNVKVNVGMGASNPNERMQKFLFATQAAIGLVNNAPPGFNVMEAVKEIYSNAGYRDGARFMSQQQDPRLMKAMGMIQQLQGMLKGKQMEMQAQAMLEDKKLQSNERINAAKLQVDGFRIQGDLQIRAAELEIEKQRIELERLKAQVDLKGATEEQQAKLVEIAADIEQANMKLEGEKMKLLALKQKTDAEVTKAALDLQSAREINQNESRIGKVASEVSGSMKSIGSEIQKIKSEIGILKDVPALKGKVDMIGQGMAAMMSMQAGRKKPTGFKMKKKGGKTVAIQVTHSDGSVEEMPVMQG